MSASPALSGAFANDFVNAAIDSFFTSLHEAYLYAFIYVASMGFASLRGNGRLVSQRAKHISQQLSLILTKLVLGQVAGAKRL